MSNSCMSLYSIQLCLPSHIYTLEKLLFYILYLHSEESVCIPECNRSESSRDEKEVPVKEDALTGKKTGNCVSLIVPQQDCQLQDLLKQLRTPAASQRVQLHLMAVSCCLQPQCPGQWSCPILWAKQICHCIAWELPREQRCCRKGSRCHFSVCVCKYQASAGHHCDEVLMGKDRFSHLTTYLNSLLTQPIPWYGKWKDCVIFSPLYCKANKEVPWHWANPSYILLA